MERIGNTHKYVFKTVSYHDRALKYDKSTDPPTIIVGKYDIKNNIDTIPDEFQFLLQRPPTYIYYSFVCH